MIADYSHAHVINVLMAPVDIQMLWQW